MEQSYSSTAHRIIREELDNLPGPKKYSDTDVFIPCPFHEDTDPSCGVLVAPGSGIPLGWTHCFGCGANGPWNMLADKLGLTKISQDDSIESRAVVDDDSMAKRRVHVGLDDSPIELPAGVPYPYKDWRSINGRLVRKVNGILALDRFEDVSLYLPVERYVDSHTELAGIIRARLKKEAGEASYVLESGSVVKESGLFPLRHTLKVLAKGRRSGLVLVEGPRDALRLLSFRIPALSIVSTTQWSNSKAASVAGICRRFSVKPIAMMDADKEGQKAQREVLRSLKQYSSEIGHPGYVDLTRYGDDKMDPGNAPRRLLQGIIRKMTRD